MFLVTLLGALSLSSMIPSLQVQKVMFRERGGLLWAEGKAR